MGNTFDSARRINIAPSRRRRASVAVLLSLMLAATANANNEAAEPETPSVEVVGTAPLPGIGTPVNQVPANVQILHGRDLSRQQARDLSEAVERNLGGVHTNAAQNNPFQSDVSFRGFAASPLLGTPQGLSVFVDGVRVNESFGDSVNWDLIPPSAISSVNLIPGSNPVFGLNTLGGALSINTKSGFADPGFSAQTTTGSFGRKTAQVEWGGHGQNVDQFLTANTSRDHGWAEHNASQVNQLFTKTGWRDGSSDFDVSFMGADNTFFGNQALPLSMFDNPRQAYTYPDRTLNQLVLVNAKASRSLSDSTLAAGNVYYRRLDSGTYNSNVNDQFDPLSPVAPGNMPAANIVAQTDQTALGASLQLSLLNNWAGRANRLTLGAGIDRGRTDFTQYTQESDFTADRGTPLASSGVLSTHVNATNTYYGIYATDTLALGDTVHLTVSGRYNQARVQLSDRIGTALNGDHDFHRVNPALGITYNPNADLTSYVSYNEGMRVPNPVELTCADRNAPCSLPNIFLADPPLKPVISRTWEGGVRGRLGPAVRWNSALFRTDLGDDIQFISAAGAALNAGYFQNVGTTRRQGVELGLNAVIERLTLNANYALIDATFRTPLTLSSPNNSQADGSGNISVSPGNRIPGIPRDILKLRGEYAVSNDLSAAVGVMAASRQYVRGDENNQDRNGPLPGYAVVNVDMRYQLAAGWRVFGTIDNLFNRKYSTFGMLGENVFTGLNNTYDYTGALFRPEQFRSAAPPRGIWIGLQYAFDAAKK